MSTRKSIQVVQCKQCRIGFSINVYELSRGRGIFCSLSCAMRARARPIEDRFWNLIVKTDSCWIWIGKKNVDGYGHIKTLDRHTVAAHRLSWEIHYGKIPEGMKVLHNCPDGDNPSCVNPKHLWLGTQADNMKDMASKGRAIPVKGKVLTDDLVRSFRSRVKGGESIMSICREFSHINRTTIRFAVVGITWKHVV